MPDLPIYIDGVRRINFMNGMIRMELVYSQPRDDDEHHVEKAAELLMSPDGFLSVLKAVNQTAKMLAEKKILMKDKHVPDEKAG